MVRVVNFMLRVFLPHKKCCQGEKSETNCSPTPFLNIKVPGFIPTDTPLSLCYKRLKQNLSPLFFVLEKNTKQLPKRSILNQTKQAFNSNITFKNIQFKYGFYKLRRL